MATDPRELSSKLMSFDDNVVTLVVGHNRQHLVAHCSRLERNSSFFQALFKREWKENHERQVVLPEDDPALVNIYLNFIYAGKLFCKTPDTVTFEGADRALYDTELMTLAKLFCFGERLQDIALKDAVIDAFIAKANFGKGGGYFPMSGEIDFVYKGTCAGSIGASA